MLRLFLWIAISILGTALTEGPIGMGELWYPEADRRHVATMATTLKGGNAYATLHVTAGTYYNPNEVGSYFGHQGWPHMTIDRDGQAYQHIAAHLGARSLRNASGGIETNQLGSVHFQIEVVAQPVSHVYAESQWPTEAQLETLAKVAHWLYEEWGVPIRYPDRMAATYGEANNGSFRFTNEEALAWEGWMGHQHWGEGNDHWDPGLLNIETVYEEYYMRPEVVTFMEEMYDNIVGSGGNARSMYYDLEAYREMAALSPYGGNQPREVVRWWKDQIDVAKTLPTAPPPVAGVDEQDVIDEIIERLENG